MSLLANATSNAEPIATASAAPLLQQTAQLHIQSTLQDAYQGWGSLVDTYLPSALWVSFPLDGAELGKRGSL